MLTLLTVPVGLGVLDAWGTWVLVAVLVGAVVAVLVAVLTAVPVTVTVTVSVTTTCFFLAALLPGGGLSQAAVAEPTFRLTAITAATSSRTTPAAAIKRCLPPMVISLGTLFIFDLLFFVTIHEQVPFHSAASPLDLPGLWPEGRLLCVNQFARHSIPKG